MANTSLLTPEPTGSAAGSDEVDHARISRQLRQHPEFEHGAGADESAIRAAEAHLGVKFPAAYRRFLSDFGWGFFADFEICGLGTDVPVWMDVVKVTQMERGNGMLALPAHLLPIHAEGDGDQVCIDLRGTAGLAAPVVFWDHSAGSGQTPTLLAGDFLNWLADLL